MYKRGISAIVAVVLMVLISVAGIGVLYAGILPMLDTDIQSSENAISIDTAGGYTLYDENYKIACVQVKRESSLEIEGLKVLFSVEGNSQIFLINSSNIPELNQKKTYCFSLENIGKPDTVTVVTLPEKGGVAVTSVVPVNDLTVQALSSIFGSGYGTGGENSGSGLIYSVDYGRYYYNSDGDGYGNSLNYSYFILGSQPVKFVSLGGDCNDSNSSKWRIFRGYLDGDGDGYGSGSLLDVCLGESLGGYSDNSNDCNDSRGDISPGASEIMNNGVDENCDGWAGLSNCSNLTSSGVVYRLENDLVVDGSKTCFVITGENITFNLNGKMVNGQKITYFASYGIHLKDSNYSSVINGKVKGFGNGVLIGDSNYNLVKDMDVSYNHYAGVLIEPTRKARGNHVETVNASYTIGGYGFQIQYSGANVTDIIFEKSFSCGNSRIDSGVNCWAMSGSGAYLSGVSGKNNTFGPATINGLCAGWPVLNTDYTNCA